jgi:acyl-coenzyme A thioesterase PaaI-like protein
MADDASTSGKSPWPDHVRGISGAEVTPRRAEMRRLADAMRGVIHRLVMSNAPLEELTAAADELELIAERFSEFDQQGSIYEGFAESANAGDPHAFFDHSPMIGKANPLAPPIELRIEEGVVYGKATFGAAYEGPPGCVHGGYIAAAFDEVLGATQSLSGAPGMTGRLTVHYRKPTPLHTELRFEGELTEVDGRKIHTVGRLYAGELLTAEAEALFISMDIARFAELRARRDARRLG